MFTAQDVLSATEFQWQLAAVCRDAQERSKHWLLVFAHIWNREEELGVTEKNYSLHWCVEDAQRQGA